MAKSHYRRIVVRDIGEGITTDALEDIFDQLMVEAKSAAHSHANITALLEDAKN